MATTVVYLVYYCHNDYANIWKELHAIFSDKARAENFVDINNYELDEAGRLNVEWYEYQSWNVDDENGSAT